MSIYPETEHTKIQKLLTHKIRFDPRAQQNNMEILKAIALEGPMLKWGVSKSTGINYPTVSRRIDSLFKDEYLGEAGTRVIERGQQSEETEYGLTWKGFIASLSIDEIRKSGILVLKKNTLLSLPEKNLILAVAEDIWEPQKIELLFNMFLFGYLYSNAPPLEDLNANDLQGWLIPIFQTGTDLDFIKDNDVSFKTENRNLLTLLDNPEILHYVKTNLIPTISNYEQNMRDYIIFIKILNELGKFLLQLEIEDSPSKKLMEFIERDFPSKMSEFKKLLEESA